MSSCITNHRISIALAERRPDRAASLWVPVGLAVGPLVSLGLARFAYALLLPPMRADLGWSYAQAGAMNTANAIGYLVGALATARLAQRYGARPTFLVGVFGTAAALVGSGMATSDHLLLAFRAAAGLFGALAFVVGATLAAEAATGASRNRQGLFITIYFAGAGLGVVLSSLIVPLALTVGATGWRWGWIGFGAASLLAGALALPAVRHRAANAPEAADHRSTHHVSLGPMATSYALLGAGYIAYMTFIIAFLRGEHLAPGIVATFWTVLGATSIATTFGWGYVLSRLRGGWAMVVVLAAIAGGAGAPLLAANSSTALLSAMLFGGAMMAGPAAATAFVRRARPPKAWTAEIGWLTILFGLGQCIGPLLAGALSDSPSGIRLGLLVSVGILALAALVAAFQREPEATSAA